MLQHFSPFGKHDNDFELHEVLQTVERTRDESYLDCSWNKDFVFCNEQKSPIFIVFPSNEFQIRQKFELLRDQWKKDTKHCSSFVQICMHPAYQQIIGMGFNVLSLILQDLKEGSGDWFWALFSITGENPVNPENIGVTEKMRNDWLDFARKKQWL